MRHISPVMTSLSGTQGAKFRLGCRWIPGYRNTTERVDRLGEAEPGKERANRRGEEGADRGGWNKLRDG